MKPGNKDFNYGLRRLSDRLFYARIKAKLTLEDVAKTQNITAKTVTRWETRGGIPKNKKFLMELAKTYNVSYPWLSTHYGSEEHNFEQGFELFNELWDKLGKEKQKDIMIYTLKLIEAENVNCN